MFDIETVPDVELGRRLLGLEGLDDGQVASAMYTLQRQKNGSEFLPLEQHRVVDVFLPHIKRAAWTNRRRAAQGAAVDVDFRCLDGAEDRRRMQFDRLRHFRKAGRCQIVVVGKQLDPISVGHFNSDVDGIALTQVGRAPEMTKPTVASERC